MKLVYSDKLHFINVIVFVPHSEIIARFLSNTNSVAANEEPPCVQKLSLAGQRIDLFVTALQ